MTPESSLLPGSLLASVGGAAATWALATICGHALLFTRDELDADEAAGRLLTAAVAGTVLQSLLVLALSLANRLEPLALVAAALASAGLAAAWRGKRLLAEASLALRSPRRSRMPPLPGILLAFVVALTCVLATLPTVHYDDLVYHLGLPRQALLTGSWPAQAGFHYSYFPAGWDAVHALPLAIGGGLGAQWRNAFALVLFIAAAWRLARRSGSPTAAGVGVALLTAAPMMPSLGAYASNDLFVGLAAAVAFERALAGRRFEAALAGGAAWGAKYTGLAVLAALSLLLGFAPGELRWRARGLRAGAALGVGLLLPAAWTLRTWWLTGNPVFPAFWSQLGGRGWNAIAAEGLKQDVASGTIGDRGWIALLLAPLDWLLRPGELALFGGVQPAFLLAAGVGLFVARRHPDAGRLAAALGVLHLGACLTCLYPRFALPLFVLLLPFTAAAIDALLDATKASPRALRRGLALTLVLTCLWSSSRGLLRHLSDYGSGPEVLLEDRSEVLPARIFLARAERDLARHLPADAQVLVVAEGRMALLPRVAIVSSGYDPSRPALLSQADDDRDRVAERFAAVTHVLLNARELERFETSYSYRSHFAGDGRDAFFDWLGGLTPVARWGPVILSETSPPAAR
jgi:hypothetical protein